MARLVLIQEHGLSLTANLESGWQELRQFPGEPGR